MKMIWRVYTYELRRNLARRGYLFSTFGLPLLIFALIFGYNFLSTAFATEPAEEEPAAFELDLEGIEVAGYVDQSGLFLTVPDRLAANLVRYEDEDAARAAMTAGDIDVFYSIPADYLETRDIMLHVPGPQISLINSQLMSALVYETLAADVDQSVLRRLQSNSTFQDFNLTQSANGEAASDMDANFFMLYVFTIIFLLCLFLTNGYLMQSVIEEKETRLVEILIASISPYQLLFGKVLAMATLGLTQVLVWGVALIIGLNLASSLPAFATVALLANIRIPYEMLPVMLIYFILGYLMIGAFYSAVGAISNSMREGPQYAVFFTLPIALPFYFFAIFSTTPNATIPVVLSIFPLTSPISMMMRMSVTQVPLIEVLISLGALALMVLFAVWIAGRVFRVNTLLSGQVPSLKDLPKLLRG